jgi:hypothetical protein
MTRSIRRLAVGAVAAAALGTLLVAAGPAGAAAPPGSFEVDYDASGTSTIHATGSSVTLGPATLKTYISDSGDGTLTGDMSLPTTSTTFNAIGFLPTSATVSFIPSSGLTGLLSAEPPLTISASAHYYIKLSNVKVAGIPALVGNSCQTASPVDINIATPAGQSFDVGDGGTLAGTYTIGSFHNCGLLTTPLINLLVPGPGNTVSFQLSNGQFVE